jgi:nitrite reductase (NADH) large subunit
VIALEDLPNHRYRKLVIAEGKLVGAILIGYPEDTAPVQAAIKGGLDVTRHLAALRAGDWSTLRAAGVGPAATLGAA